MVMKMFKQLVMILFAAVAGLGAQKSDVSANQRVLVIGLDAHEQSVPSSSPLFIKVRDNLTRRLAGIGIVPVTPADMGVSREVLQSQTGTNLLGVLAPDIQRSVDAIISYALFVRSRGPISARRIESRMQGEVRDVASGERLGAFDVSFPFDHAVPQNCSRVCMLEEAASQADEMARVLGRDIMSLLKNGGVRLSDARLPSAPASSIPSAKPSTAQTETSGNEASVRSQVTISFDGFTSDELALIYDYVPAFEGHVELGKPWLDGSKTELTLFSESDLAALHGNLSSLLLHLDLSGKIVAQGGIIRVVRAD